MKRGFDLLLAVAAALVLALPVLLVALDNWPYIRLNS